MSIRDRIKLMKKADALLASAGGAFILLFEESCLGGELLVDEAWGERAGLRWVGRVASSRGADVVGWDVVGRRLVHLDDTRRGK